MVRIRILIFICCLSMTVSGRDGGYPLNYFSPPMDIPLTAVGVFGEIRPDHLHSGLDLSTMEKEGIPVKAAAAGYVSRIKISPDGFGKAIYLTHPNGYVTVYAHLQRFTKIINQFVKKFQYDKQSFEVEIFPKPTDFIIKKGQIIAYSGNSGSSAGPHLHFEIRDQKSEEPLNPLLFGLNLPDHVAPELKSIRIFPAPGAGIVNKTDTAVNIDLLRNKDGSYELKNKSSIEVFGKIGIGFEAYDHEDKSASELGIYSAELFVDNKLCYSWKMDRFNFRDSRYVNAHLDYQSLWREKKKIQRCFRLPGNHLVIYGDTTASGYQDFRSDGSHDIRIVVKDFSGNESKVEFPLHSRKSLASNSYQSKPAGSLHVSNSKGNSLHKEDLDIVIPDGAVYQDYFFTYNERKDSRYLSSVFHIGDPEEALQTSITVGIKTTRPVPENLKSKLVLASVNQDGKLSSEGGNWNGVYFTGKTRHFGEFTIVADTIPPIIQKKYFPPDKSLHSGGKGSVAVPGEISVTIRDTLSGIKTYACNIDGKWFLFEYDLKNHLLKADISELRVKKEHSLEVKATDNCGNTSHMEARFFY